jgi:hypothetical protein
MLWYILHSLRFVQIIRAVHLYNLLYKTPLLPRPVHLNNNERVSKYNNNLAQMLRNYL